MQVLRKVGDKVPVVKARDCAKLQLHSSVGLVSNSGHDDIPWKGVGEKMSAGYRPRTGWHDRKKASTGRRSNPRGLLLSNLLRQSMRHISCQGIEVFMYFLGQRMIML